MPRKARQRPKSLVVYSTQSWENSQPPDLPFNAVVATVHIQDPYNSEKEITAIQSLRDDHLAALKQRRQINDAEFEAGKQWQELYEISQVGGIQAIDTRKEPVDGGGLIVEPITDRQRKAQRKLTEAAIELGPTGNTLVRDVLGQKLTVSHAAGIRGLYSERDINYIGRRFRECLETLAVFWGFAMRKT